MPRPIALFAALAAMFFLAPGNSPGQQAPGDGLPSRNPAFNAYYETLVIPISKEIAAELKLIDAQKAALAKLLSREVSRTNWTERGKHKHEVAKILTPDQRERLAQLTLQFQGALVSLNLPRVATRLGLTPDQKQRLATIEFLQNAGTKNFHDYEKTLYGPAAKGGRFVAQLQRSCDCLAESVLLPAQMMKWRDMQGKPLATRPAEWN